MYYAIKQAGYKQNNNVMHDKLCALCFGSIPDHRLHIVLFFLVIYRPLFQQRII